MPTWIYKHACQVVPAQCVWRPLAQNMYVWHMNLSLLYDNDDTITDTLLGTYLNKMEIYLKYRQDDNNG